MTRQQALDAATRRLRAEGLEEAGVDARLLLQAVEGIDRVALLREPDAGLSDAAIQRYGACVGRRLAGEPVARILGARDFYGRAFALSPATLDPRADTETLVDAALAFARSFEGPLTLLDLGTGSGALLVTLLAELPAATGIGTDLSPDAVVTARANARRHGVADRASFVAGSWGDALDRRFALIVSNPPYIPRATIPTLSREVRLHDPPLALDGGEDGLDAYRVLATALPRLLAPNGRGFLEIGHDQGDAVPALLASAGLRPLGVLRDFGGRPRVVPVAWA